MIFHEINTAVSQEGFSEDIATEVAVHNGHMGSYC